jgi:hypothetical protein
MVKATASDELAVLEKNGDGRTHLQHYSIKHHFSSRVRVLVLLSRATCLRSSDGLNDERNEIKSHEDDDV